MRRIRHFLRDERAAITAEFVLAFPVVFLFLVVTLELTFLMARSTLLQQALDVTMREVRLGNIVNPGVLELEDMVCDRISVIPACQSSMTLEFTRVDQATFQMPGQQAPCVRRDDEALAARAGDIYDTGVQNDLMVVRACMVIDAITPFFGSEFELFARTAFVNEPTDD